MKGQEIITLRQEKHLLSIPNISPEELFENERIIQKHNNRLGGPPKIVSWFLPEIKHVLKGGIRTALAIAEKMSERFRTVNNIVIVNYTQQKPILKDLSKQFVKHFPNMKFNIFAFRTPIDDPKDLPESDCAIATLWTTAYVCARYSKTKAKFYLVQDFEPSFYPAGSIYSMIEQTYRLNFAILANTIGVANSVKKYTSDVTEFSPGIDLNLFNPSKSKEKPGEPFKIVFYGRPGNARNCFSFGINVLHRVKNRLRSSVEIVSVGAEWSAPQLGLQNSIKNLGLLSSMEKVAELYRNSDLGVSFMSTPHPSYQPLEYMASGCVNCSIKNEATSWLINSENSLILTPILEVAEKEIVELVEDCERWKKLREEGIKTVKKFTWEDSFEKILNRICS